LLTPFVATILDGLCRIVNPVSYVFRILSGGIGPERLYIYSSLLKELQILVILKIFNPVKVVG
jgi:hypothetical protein